MCLFLNPTNIEPPVLFHLETVPFFINLPRPRYFALSYLVVIIIVATSINDGTHYDHLLPPLPSLLLLPLLPNTCAPPFSRAPTRYPEISSGLGLGVYQILPPDPLRSLLISIDWLVRGRMLRL
jgi:hypothetical protein